MYCVYTALWYQIYDQNIVFVLVPSASWICIQKPSRPPRQHHRHLITWWVKFTPRNVHSNWCLVPPVSQNSHLSWAFQLINMLEIFKVSNVAKWISKLLNIPGGCNSKKGFILHFCVKWTYHQNAWSEQSSFWFSPQPFWIRFVMSWSSVVGETCFGSKRAIDLETSWFAYLYIIERPRMRCIYIYINNVCIFFKKVYMYIPYHITSIDMYQYWLLYIFFFTIIGQAWPISTLFHREFGSQTIWSRAAWRLMDTVDGSKIRE